MRALVTTVVAALCALLQPLAAGGQVNGTSEELLIEARAWSTWPDRLSKGYMPLEVEVVNRGPARVFRISANSGSLNDKRILVRHALALEPGAVGSVELLAPLRTANTSTYSIEVEADGTSLRLGPIGAPQWSNGAPEQVAGMVFADRVPAGSELASWSEAVSWKASGSQQTVFMGGRSRTITTGPAKTGAVDDNLVLGGASWADLPRRSEAYSSLDLVVLDVASEPPPAERLAPLWVWVREGGTVLLAGAGSEALLRRPALAAWLEPRFRRERPVEVPAWSMGLGRVLVARSGTSKEPPAAAFSSEAHARALRVALDHEGDSPSFATTWRPSIGGPALAIPGLDDIPYRGFTVLLVLFTLLIGPVNFALTRRLGRPQLLLLTIPAVAAVATLSVLAYGVLAQGLDTKASVRSLTLVDQRATADGPRATTRDERLVFAGSSPGRLSPESGTVLVSHLPGTWAWEQLDLEVDLTRATELAGDFLPTRRRVEQFVASDRPTRLRLEVRREGEELVVENGLGVRLLALAVRDAEGAYYVLPEGLAADGTARLRASDPGRARADVADASLHPEQFRLREADHELLRGTWIARLAANPFLDDLGVELAELEGDHRALGVLPLESAAEDAR